jgi:TRAP-type C4-dicarboxylate transport system substrate-binding protein
VPTDYPATSMPGEGLAFWQQSVAELGRGKLEIVPKFDGAAGVRAGALMAAVRERRFPAADILAGNLEPLDPVFLASSLPFLAPSIDHARRLYDAAKPAYDAALERHGLMILYSTPWPPTGLWSKKPVTGASELAGLAVRTYDATGTAVMRAAGAAPVELSFGDTVPRLKDGSITAVLSSGDGGAGRRLWEQLPHFTAIEYAMPVSLTVVERGTLEVLPPDLLAAVIHAATSTEARQWEAVRTRLQANYAQMRANGVDITTEPSHELRAALKAAAIRATSAWTERTGPDGRAILDRYWDYGSIGARR